jgi:hypothetical protein
MPGTARRMPGTARRMPGTARRMPGTYGLAAGTVTKAHEQVAEQGNDPRANYRLAAQQGGMHHVEERLNAVIGTLREREPDR